MSLSINLTPKEIALIKTIRGRQEQVIVIKAKDGDIILVERIDVSKNKESNLLITVEKKEKLYPV